MSIVEKIKLIGGAVLSVIPGAQPFAPLILAGLTIAEESQKPGADKRLIGAQVVKLSADTANTIKPGTVNTNQALVAYDNSVDAVIAAVNTFKDLEKIIIDPLAKPVFSW